MQDFLILYSVGLLASASLLMAWFGSGLPLHVADILSVIFKDNELLSDITTSAVGNTKTDWEINVMVRSMHHNKAVQLLIELLLCRICLSFHVSFWISLTLAILTPATWALVPIAVCTWPVLVNLIIKKVI